MSRSLRTALLALAASCLLAGTAAAAQWRVVPGATELEIDIGSLQQERTRASAWLRWWGRPALVPELAAWGPRAPRVVRTATQLEFDCGHRTVRTLAVQAYGSSGAPVFLSAIAGPALPVQGGDLAWAYDAVCEAARSGSRL